MEIEVTDLVNNRDEMHNYSASQMEKGANVGDMTWKASLSVSSRKPLIIDPEHIKEAKRYFGEFGAWSREEIAKWDDIEVNALLLQLIAGDIREMEAYDNEAEYLKASEEGQVSGSLFKTESGDWFYYVGC